MNSIPSLFNRDKTRISPVESHIPWWAASSRYRAVVDGKIEDGPGQFGIFRCGTRVLRVLSGHVTFVAGSAPHLAATGGEGDNAGFCLGFLAGARWI